MKRKGEAKSKVVQSEYHPPGPNESFGPGDWLAKLTRAWRAQPAPPPAQRKLMRTIKMLYANEPLSARHSRWLHGVLVDIYNGKDVRTLFDRPRSPGRKIVPDDHKFFIALDAALIREKCGVNGKALWGKLAEKWGYPDGSIKNFITIYDAKAQWMRKYVTDDAIEKVMPEHLARYGKAQQSK